MKKLRLGCLENNLNRILCLEKYINEEATRFVCTNFLVLNFLSLIVKMPLPSCYREGNFHMGDLSPDVRGIKEIQCVLLAQVVSQAPLIQNNHYAKWHFLRQCVLNTYFTYLNTTMY